MKAIIPHKPHWAYAAATAVLAPFRLAGDILFCGFVVAAAFAMLLLCTLLATLDHMVVEPWKMHHPAQ